MATKSMSEMTPEEQKAHLESLKKDDYPDWDDRLSEAVFGTHVYPPSGNDDALMSYFSRRSKL